MNNIFERAKFGDKFVTQDGRIAILIDPINGEKIFQFGVLNQNNVFCQYCVSKETGILWQNGKEFEGNCDLNIVSRYYEPIDGEKFDLKKAREWFKNRLFKRLGINGWDDEFKDFKKAMEK